jgi:chromate reductase, NAD(P)H dehydrogenase (quinone)
MAGSVRILGIAGSLRQGSFNAAALRAAVELAPEGVAVEPASIRDIPLYDGDLEKRGFPEPVVAFRAAVASADAVLFVTPEYNHSVPGVLKNAIDWASRPPSQPFDGKPVGMMGASGGPVGTARAQAHLRHIMVSINALPLNRPQVLIGQAESRFEDGRLTDETSREHVRALLVALAAWTRRLQGSAA